MTGLASCEYELQVVPNAPRGDSTTVTLLILHLFLQREVHRFLSHIEHPGNLIVRTMIPQARPFESEP